MAITRIARYLTRECEFFPSTSLRSARIAMHTATSTAIGSVFVELALEIGRLGKEGVGTAALLWINC